MLRFLLKLSLIVTIIFAVTGFVARALGGTQPPNPALRGFTEGCEDKPQPCWYGIVPGVTKFDDVPKIIDTNWEHASVEKSLVALVPIWRITNANFTDCTVTVDQNDKSFDLVGQMDFRNCSHILFVDLADFIEYPGSIYPNCILPDRLTYRLIYISTVDNLTFWGENPVKEFILHGQQTKTEWLELLNQTVQNNAGSDYWTKEFRYAKIGVVVNGCG